MRDREKSGSFPVSKQSNVAAFGLAIQGLLCANEWWELAVAHYGKPAWFTGLCQESDWGHHKVTAFPM